MGRAIGIRVTPSAIFYCIVDLINYDVEIVVLDKLNNPKALIIPEQLKFLRNTVCDIINEFEVKTACIRITESNARKITIQRIYIEGILQELFASSSIEKYYVGQISSISSKLGIQRSSFKPFAEGKEDFLNIENWSKHSLEERESIMSAISALNL